MYFYHNDRIMEDLIRRNRGLNRPNTQMAILYLRHFLPKYGCFDIPSKVLFYCVIKGKISTLFDVSQNLICKVKLKRISQGGCQIFVHF